MCLLPLSKLFTFVHHLSAITLPTQMLSHNNYTTPDIPLISQHCKKFRISVPDSMKTPDGTPTTADILACPITLLPSPTKRSEQGNSLDEWLMECSLKTRDWLAKITAVALIPPLSPGWPRHLPLLIQYINCSTKKARRIVQKTYLNWHYACFRCFKDHRIQCRTILAPYGTHQLCPSVCYGSASSAIWKGQRVWTLAVYLGEGIVFNSCVVCFAVLLRISLYATACLSFSPKRLTQSTNTLGNCWRRKGRYGTMRAKRRPIVGVGERQN